MPRATKRIREAWRAFRYTLAHPGWMAERDDWAGTPGDGAVEPTDQQFETFVESVSLFPTFSACVGMAKALITDVPLRVVDSDGEAVDDGDPIAELFAHPNPGEGPGFFKQTLADQWHYFGNVWIATDGPTDTPNELWILRSHDVRLIPNRSNKYPIAGVRYGGPRKSVTIPAEALIHARRPNPKDPLYGLATMDECRESLKMLWLANELNQSRLKRGVRVGGTLRVPRNTTDAEIDAIRAQIKSQRQGVKKAFEPMIVRADDYDWQPDQQTAKDAEEQATYDRAEQKVYNVFGFPSALFEPASEINRATVDAARAMAYTNSIRPMLTLICEQVNAAPFMRSRRYSLEADWSAVEALQPNRLELIQGEVLLLEKDAVVVNEVRDRLGLGEAVEWGDEPKKPAPSPFGMLPAPEEEEPEQAEERLWAAPSATRLSGDQIAELAALKDAGALHRDDRTAARTLAELGDARAKKWLSADEIRMKREARWMRRVRALFHDLEDEVLDNVAGLRRGLSAGTGGNGNGTAVRMADEIPPTAVGRPLFDADELERAWTAALSQLGRGDIQAGADFALRTVDLKVPFDVDSLQVREFLKVWTADKVTRMSQTQRRTIAALVETAAREGHTTEQLSQAIRDKFAWDRNVRSAMIAQTEAGALYNKGAHLGLEEAGVTTKEWLSARDTSVRATHREADGQVVPLAQDFKVGSAHGPAPGQMSEAGENIRCRCALTAGGE